MIPHRDEILRPAVSTDATAVPRYDIVRPDGTISEKNAALRLANPVAREGTPISKAALDEMLAASGVTAGTATAYTLAQEEYTLFDGAPVRFRLHVASGDGATLNINGTGAKPLRDMMGAAMPGGIPAGTWITAYYSAAAGAYVLAGGEAVRALYGERYTVDDAVAYVKDVPADALPYAEVSEIGGMTYKVNAGTEAAPVYELRSAAATEMKSVGVNLFDKTKATLYHRVASDTGAISPGFTEVSLSDYINVKGISTFYISGDAVQSQTEHSLAFFDENKVFISGENAHRAPVILTNKMYNVPSNACYVRFNFAHSAIDSIQFEVGATASPYTPYFCNTLPIPKAVRALDGYGWGINETVRNYVDWKNRKFVKMVERVDLGTLNWSYKREFARFQAVISSSIRPHAFYNADDIISQLEYNPNVYLDDNLEDGYCVSADVIFVRSSAYTDAATFKAAMSGVMLCYELAKPIITDISDILLADNLIRVQPGGTITPVNEYGCAVPTTITYQRDVLANRASIFALEKLRLAMELLASIDYVDDTVSAAIAAAVAPLATTAALNAAVAPLAKANLSNASGTFGGVVKANAAAVSALGTAQVRNVTISATDLTAGSSALATGDSYRVYS